MPFLIEKVQTTLMEMIEMGGSGTGYDKGKKLTKEELRRRHKKGDSDAYMFDVEYQKLKAEREKIAAEYARERERFLRISEQLREEMLSGTSSNSAMRGFMSALTEKGVMLQQEQQRMQANIDTLNEDMTKVENQMNELRNKAFSGSTRAQIEPNKQYNGFKTENKSSYANAQVVEMSPEEYLRRVAFEVKGEGINEILRNASVSDVEKYARQMLRGTRYNAPTLNYRDRTTKGDERALAAILNGYSRIPVMIVE